MKKLTTWIQTEIKEGRNRLKIARKRSDGITALIEGERILTLLDVLKQITAGNRDIKQ